MKHFFDIGANSGDTFGYMGDKYRGWTVWCFEPSPRHFAALLNRAQEVSDHFDVRVCPFGLSGTTEVFQFFEMEGTLADSFFDDMDGFTKKQSSKYQVFGVTVSISDFINKHTSSDDEIVLKIDCEGSEYSLLEDLLAHTDLLNRISTIYNEFHCYHVGWRKQASVDLYKKFKDIGKPLIDWNH